MVSSLANRARALVLNTGNKSECAVGYSTLYGDTVGALGVIADLTKTEVYTLAGWYNHHRQATIIPQAIFDKASEICAGILTEHADQLKAIAEYLLVNETMEAEEFNYFFDHGEFMPISPKAAREARDDDTIERPARKISMIDGYAEEKAQAENSSEARPQEPKPESQEPGQDGQTQSENTEDKKD